MMAVFAGQLPSAFAADHRAADPRPIADPFRAAGRTGAGILTGARASAASARYAIGFRTPMEASAGDRRARFLAACMARTRHNIWLIGATGLLVARLRSLSDAHRLDHRRRLQEFLFR